MKTYRVFLSITFLLCCFMIIGCDSIYRMLDKEGSEEKELVGEVIPFQENPTIKEVQALLKLYGYSIGKVDGLLGVRTRNAIEKFQNDVGLKPTRFVDQATWENLRLFKDYQLVIDDELNIQLIQSLLLEAGFNPGKVDGKLGKQTLAAIKDFQEANNLKVDGRIGYKTLAELSKYLVSETVE